MRASLLPTVVDVLLNRPLYHRGRQCQPWPPSQPPSRGRRNVAWSPSCCAHRPLSLPRCRHAGDGVPSTETTRHGGAAWTAEAPNLTSGSWDRRRLGDRTQTAPPLMTTRDPGERSTDDRRTRPAMTAPCLQQLHLRLVGDNRPAHTRAYRSPVRCSRNRRRPDHRTLRGDLQT